MPNEGGLMSSKPTPDPITFVPDEEPAWLDDSLPPDPEDGSVCYLEDLAG
jgi:hypothetical protein